MDWIRKEARKNIDFKGATSSADANHERRHKNGALMRGGVGKTTVI